MPGHKTSRRAIGLQRAVQDGEEVGGDRFFRRHRPHRFRHDFGTTITRKGLDPLYGKELMGIKNDKVYCRYTQEALKQAAAKAYLQVMGKMRISSGTLLSSGRSNCL